MTNQKSKCYGCGHAESSHLLRKKRNTQCAHCNSGIFVPSPAQPGKEEKCKEGCVKPHGLNDFTPQPPTQREIPKATKVLIDGLTELPGLVELLSECKWDFHAGQNIGKLSDYIHFLLSQQREAVIEEMEKIMKRAKEDYKYDTDSAGGLNAVLSEIEELKKK